MRTDPFLWIGQTLDGKIAIESAAGEGAFGVVYRGRHRGFDETVAIKCLKIPDDIAHEQREKLLATFRSEAKLLHRLSRRTTGIVQALDVGAAFSPSGAWTPYIVMEWLEGETLEAELARRRAEGLPPRSAEQALELLAPAAEALVIAHELGVSHRDVKPQNLFVTRVEGKTTLKIVDFGIAKVFEASNTMTQGPRRTGAAIAAFTPQYAAPEQFNETYGATGPWTDVFAMALILIELCAGRPALAGTDVMKLYVASCDERTRPSFAACGVKVSAALEAVVRRAVAVQPETRFQSMGELWEALKTSRGDAPLAATMPAAIVHTAISGARPPSAPPQAKTGGAPATTGLSSFRPAVRTSDTPDAGENRVCTILFAEVSVPPSDELDPEETREVVDRSLQAMAACVEQYGGVVDKFAGDVVMALFGVPRATDADAERAVRAALEMQTRLTSLTFPQRTLRGLRLSLRAGINTGRVFAGAGGGTTRRDVTVIGEPVSVAARLQQSAPDGAILVGRDTYRLVAGMFEAVAQAPIEARGRTKGLAAYRVLGPASSSQDLPPTDFYGLDTKLVGRTVEMEALRSALDDAIEESRARSVTIVGPPGVGRTRVLVEIAQRAAARGAFVLSAHASSLAAGTSHHLVGSLLRGRLHLHQDDSLEVVRGKLRRAARADGSPELDDAVLRVAALLCAGGGAEDPDSITPDEAWSHSKNRASAAFARLLERFADGAPIVVVCDDLHAADDASLDLLDELVVRLAESKLLMAGAARPELYERRPHWGEGHIGHGRVDLGPLARRHVEEMAKDRLRLVDSLSDTALASLVDRVDGSPLVLVELLSLLVDAEVVRRDSGERWTADESKLSKFVLPATVHGIVQARLDCLDPEARAVLAQAAVVGRTFWEGAIDALRTLAQAPESAAETGERPPGSKPAQASTAALLAELRARQLVRAREASTFPGERELVFAEVATWEVAYDTLAQKVRRSLHRRVASWLEERGPTDATAGLVATHYDRGGDVRRASALYVRAGVHTSALGQNAEALRHLGRARELFDETETEATGGSRSALGWTGDPADVRIASWHDRARLRLELGDVLARVGRLDEAQRCYEDARSKILRAERRAEQRFDSTEAARWDARVEFRLGQLDKVRGATKSARTHVERALDLATKAGSCEDEAAMWAALAALHRRERNLEASSWASRRGLRVARAAALESARSARSAPASARKDGRARDAVSQLLVGLGTVFYARGQSVRAERCYRQAARAASEGSQAASFALNNVAAARFARDDFVSARETFMRSLTAVTKLGDLRAMAAVHNNVAECSLRLGDAQAALTHAERALRIAEPIRARADLPEMYRIVCEAQLALGTPGEALEAARRGLANAEAGSALYIGSAMTTLARAVRAAWSSHAEAASAGLAELEASLEKHNADAALEGDVSASRQTLAGVGRPPTSTRGQP